MALPRNTVAEQRHEALSEAREKRANELAGQMRQKSQVIESAMRLLVTEIPEQLPPPDR